MDTYIKDFSISNYRSCVRTRFEPQPHLSCLIGLNGSGKSSVLNGLLLLRSLTRSRHRIRETQTSASKSRLNVTFSCGDKNVYLRAQVLYLPTDKGDDQVADCSTDWNFREITNEDAWVRIPLAFLYDEPFLFEREVVFSPSHIRHFRTDQNQLRLFYGEDSKGVWKPEVVKYLQEIGIFLRGISYYSASQFTDPTRCPASFELDEDRLVRRPIRAADHMQLMLDLYRSYKKRGDDNDYNEFLDIVGPKGLGLFDKLEFKEVSLPESRYQVGVGGKVIKQKVSRNLIVPNAVQDGARLSLGQLSEGTFKTLALLFYLASDKSQILLIEEPEVCVHHGLLNSIVALIKSYSSTKQIIFSTHSDFVLDALEPEHVFLVKRQPKLGTTVRPIPKALSKANFVSLKRYLAETGNLGEYWRHGGFEGRD
jgi:ABC-type Mn2+/Zn2+ transport system ATPase subunit